MGKKISDKSAICSKCNGDIAGLTPEKRDSLERNKALDKVQSLVNHSAFALLLFLAGRFNVLVTLKLVVISNMSPAAQSVSAFVGI